MMMWLVLEIGGMRIRRVENVYDQSGRLALRSSVSAVSRRLACKVQAQQLGLGRDQIQNLEPCWTVRGWGDSRTLGLPKQGDRISDSVSIMELIGCAWLWLWLWELQSQIDYDKLDVVLEEVGRLRARCRYEDQGQHKYGVMPVLVGLKGRNYPHRLDMTWNGVGVGCDCMVWIVAEDDACEVLAEIEANPNDWPMLFWIPLMAGANNHDVVDWWLRLWERVANLRDRQGLITVAIIFSELAECPLYWASIKERHVVTESPAVNEFIRDAVEQSDLRNARKYLIRTLRRKFGTSVTDDVIDDVNNQTVVEILNDWLDKADDAPSWDLFTKSLRDG